MDSRLANIEKTLTYKIAFLTDIPKTGDMYDENYYISAVSVEIQPFFIKVTIGLSKDFNRLSQFIGISSNIRLYEVSEKMSAQRDSVISDYVVISENGDSNIKGKPLATPDFLAKIKALFTNTYPTYNNGIVQNAIDNNAITQALVRGRAYDKSLVTPQYAISLPVISSALGNSMTFNFNFADNYSAGQKVGYVKGDSSVSGYFGQYVPYCDFYGRFYWLEFALYSKPRATNDLTLPQINYNDEDGSLNPYEFPLPADVRTKQTNGYEYIRYRKESTEKPAITYQISFLTNKDETGFLIGSALCKNCALVCGKASTTELWVFPERLNVYDKRIDFTNATKITDSISAEGGGNFQISGAVSNVDGKAWAYVTPINTETITVEDETGAVTNQELVTGGEIVIGRNIDVKTGDYVGRFYMTIQGEIYGK